MQSTAPAIISIRYLLKNMIGKVVFSSVRNLKIPNTVSSVFFLIAPRRLRKRPFFFPFCFLFLTFIYVSFLFSVYRLRSQFFY